MFVIWERLVIVLMQYIYAEVVIESTKQKVHYFRYASITNSTVYITLVFGRTKFGCLLQCFTQNT